MTRNYIFKSVAAAALAALVFAAASPDASARKKKKVEEPAPLQTSETGFYKDIFMDSGIGLTSRVDLPAARYLNLQMEEFVSTPGLSNSVQMDTIIQNQMLLGNAMDENGVLFFPDGAPRFRVTYVNGGNAMIHSKGMGQEGRNAFVNFIHAGGSYIGTCAGAFFACHYKLMGDAPDALTVDDYSPKYIGIWPGVVRNTVLSKSKTGVKIEPGSALLKYYDFGGDMYVDSVTHNGGCYGITDTLWPAKGEVLARYDLTVLEKQPKRNFNDFPVIWSIKEKDEWGRVISCGSHPEGVTYGDRLHLMCAMVKYAMDGNPGPKVKAELTMGETRRMDKYTHDNMPEYTAVGDKQYHHFTVEVPEGTDTLKVSLGSVKARKNFDVYLFVNRDQFAFKDNSTWQNISLGVDKTVTIPAPKPGKYYISVYCDTTVDATLTEKGTQYSGRTDVLNGVPYTIGVNVKPAEPKK